MKYILEFFVILLLLFVGQVLELVFKLPIPATIISMLLLIILLFLKFIKLESIESTSNFLLENITFFMTPLVIGIIDKFHYFSGNFLKIIFVLVISVTVSIIFTAYITLIFIKIFCREDK